MALVDNDIMVLGNASMDMNDKGGRFGTTKEVLDNMDRVTISDLDKRQNDSIATHMDSTLLLQISCQKL